MEWICREVDSIGETFVDAERKLVRDVVRETLPFQDKLDYPRSHGRREELAIVQVKSEIVIDNRH